MNGGVGGGGSRWKGKNKAKTCTLRSSTTWYVQGNMMSSFSEAHVPGGGRAPSPRGPPPRFLFLFGKLVLQQCPSLVTSKHASLFFFFDFFANQAQNNFFTMSTKSKNEKKNDSENKSGEEKKYIHTSFEFFGLSQYFTGGKTKLIFMNWHYKVGFLGLFLIV